MAITKATTRTFAVLVHHVDVIRGKEGPDYVSLRTNFPNPMYPYMGTLSVSLQVTRKKGSEWARQFLPGVDISETDLETHSAARPNTEGESATVHSLSATDSGNRLIPTRPLLSLRRR